MEKFCSIFSFVSLQNLKQAEALGVLIGDQCKPLNNFMTTCIVLHVENGRKKKKRRKQWKMGYLRCFLLWQAVSMAPNEGLRYTSLQIYFLELLLALWVLLKPVGSVLLSHPGQQ